MGETAAESFVALLGGVELGEEASAELTALLVEKELAADTVAKLANKAEASTETVEVSGITAHAENMDCSPTHWP